MKGQVTLYAAEPGDVSQLSWGDLISKAIHGNDVHDIKLVHTLWKNDQFRKNELNIFAAALKLNMLKPERFNPIRFRPSKNGAQLESPQIPQRDERDESLTLEVVQQEFVFNPTPSKLSIIRFARDNPAIFSDILNQLKTFPEDERDFSWRDSKSYTPVKLQDIEPSLLNPSLPFSELQNQPLPPKEMNFSSPEVWKWPVGTLLLGGAVALAASLSKK